jgi:membrane-bound ClpP family serine protease
MMMTCFSTFLKKDRNHQQQRIIFLVVAAVFVAPSGPIIVNYSNAVANPVFAQQQQQQDDNTIDDQAILWVDVKDFISSGTAEDISMAIKSTLPAAGSSSQSSSFSAVILALDTPGGSLDATFGIIDAIQQSPVPVM